MRNHALLLLSLSFYGWGEPWFLLPLILSSLADYLISRKIAALDGRACLKKSLFALAVALNIGMLALFKYAGGIAGMGLPLGISFFVFQKISYLADVCRGKTPAASSFSKYLLYITLFPQLVLGPIVRYHEIEKQLDGGGATEEDFLAGLWRFSLGLARKMLIATPLAAITEAAFMNTAQAPDALAAWIGIYAYAMQLYFDFSGYTDMALGVGRMFGFRFPENFNAPYVSRDMAQFWRRWHITLGAFMKEYVYIPLGGNKCSAWRSGANLWIVFLLSGIWHGATANFLVWGAWHGLWITASKAIPEKTKGAFSFLSVPATFLLVLFGWVFFRIETFGDALNYLASMFSLGAETSRSVSNAVMEAITPGRLLSLIAATFFAFIPAFAKNCKAFCEGARLRFLSFGTRTAITAILLFLSTVPLVSSSFNPFIYFKF